MKKVFAMLLCAMMVAGMMAGCTQNQQTSADQTSQQTATEETKEEEKTEETSAESSEIKAPEKDVEMQYISVEDATKVLDSDDYTFLDVRKAETITLPMFREQLVLIWMLPRTVTLMLVLQPCSRQQRM